MKDYIQTLVDLFGHHDYSPSTRKRVQQWLADEEHATEKQEALHKLWEEAGQQAAPDGMQRSIRHMRQNLGIQATESGRRIQLLVWKAAAIFLLAVSAVSIYLMLENAHAEKDLIEHYIPVAEVHELTLPDGTHVMLNSQSTLLYPHEFDGKTRSVYLIGEADFKVHPDKEHPFIVKANDCQITALGTEFNVNAYPENDEVVATLLEGSVKVEFNSLTDYLILQPNQQLTYNKQTKAHQLKQPEIEDVTAWQRGELVFSNMNLGEIFTSLERKFPYTFVYSPRSLKDNTYSFRFRQQASLEEVMEIMSQVAGNIHYVIKGNKCYITNESTRM